MEHAVNSALPHNGVCRSYLPLHMRTSQQPTSTLALCMSASTRYATYYSFSIMLLHVVAANIEVPFMSEEESL